MSVLFAYYEVYTVDCLTFANYKLEVEREYPVKGKEKSNKVSSTQTNLTLTILRIESTCSNSTL